MSSVYKRGNAEVRASMTPMIDVTFLLIVFFVLVSQIVEVETVELDLPQPIEPLTEPPGDEQRTVINVIPGAGGGAAGYRLGGRTFAAAPEGVEAMTTALVGLYGSNPGLNVNLRADRRTQYEWVEPVMQAVSTAAARAGEDRSLVVIPRVNLVVVRED